MVKYLTKCMFRMMKKKSAALFMVTVFLVLPFVVVADPYPGIIGLKGAVDVILSVVAGLFAAFAVVMFFVAGILFLSARGEPDKVKQARLALFWGIIGVVVGLLARGVVPEFLRLLGV